MARWRLTAGHYLNVPGNEWEYKETNRDTGRQQRVVFPVPMLLDPQDASAHNYPGEIIVSNGKFPQPRDYIFEGPPTPDMEPLDDEAQAITDKERPKWIHPIESLPGQSYSQSLLDRFESEIAKLQAGQPAPRQAIPVNSIDPDAFAKLQEQVAALAEQNALLQGQLAEEHVDRRA